MFLDFNQANRPALNLWLVHKDSASSVYNDNSAKRRAERGPEMQIGLAALPNTVRSAMMQRIGRSAAIAGGNDGAAAARSAMLAQTGQQSSDEGYGSRSVGPVSACAAPDGKWAQ